MVIPGNKHLSENFHVFDNFINAVNSARRNARDYVTDSSLEKLDQELAGETNRDWRCVGLIFACYFSRMKVSEF